MRRSPSPHADAPPPTEPAAVEAELIRRFLTFYTTWSERGDGVFERIRDMMSPEISGFGTGRLERFSDKAKMLDVFRREMEEMPHAFSVRFAWTEAKQIAPTVGIVDTEAVATMPVGDGETVSFDLRITAVFRLEEGEWRIVYNHGSMPSTDQVDGEVVPIHGLRARNQELERLVAERTADLRAAQAQLVHQEKMASLGALTAGIAHEIKNPLNFVTNFAALGVELADELGEAGDDERAGILADLRANAARIAEHGARADAIVTGMMQHAQGGTGQRQLVSLNALVEEYAGHARHGLLARDPDAEVTLSLRLGDDVGEVEAVPQEIGRVVVALLSNAFDAVREGAEAGTVTVSTARTASGAEVRVADNGPGIGSDVLGRVFEPFYTTKPTGQGHTGLGLSLAHDTVVQGHGGTLTVESVPGEGAAFVLALPVSEPTTHPRP